MHAHIHIQAYTYMYVYEWRQLKHAGQMHRSLTTVSSILLDRPSPPLEQVQQRTVGRSARCSGQAPKVGRLKCLAVVVQAPLPKA